MSVSILSESRELRRIAALLDRMDPAPRECTVPGCVHDHAAVNDTPPTLAAA